MFDALSNRLQDVFQSLKGGTRLTEATVERVLGEIRLALLEADVNFKVVKAFVDRVRDRRDGCRGPEGPESVAAGHQDRSR